MSLSQYFEYYVYKIATTEANCLVITLLTLYWCYDQAYVKELDPHRKTMLLLNKSDLLTLDARYGL